MPDIRSRIIEGSRPLFAKYGFRKLTMDQIAREMHISKRTIYEHFGSKAELVETVCDSLVNHDREQLRRCLDKADGPVGKMRALFRLYDLEGFGSAILNRKELDALHECFPTAWEKLPTLIRTRETLVGEVYNEGVQQGVFMSQYPKIPGSDVKELTVDETIGVIVYLASSLITEMLTSDEMVCGVDMDTTLQYSCDILLRAIAVR